MKDVHRFARLGVRLKGSANCGVLVHNNSDSSFVIEVKSKQLYDPLLKNFNESVLSTLNESFSIGGWGTKRYQNILCVSDVDDLRNRVLEEAHGSRYSIHPSSTKMYRDHREVYW